MSQNENNFENNNNDEIDIDIFSTEEEESLINKDTSTNDIPAEEYDYTLTEDVSGEDVFKEYKVGEPVQDDEDIKEEDLSSSVDTDNNENENEDLDIDVSTDNTDFKSADYVSNTDNDNTPNVFGTIIGDTIIASSYTPEELEELNKKDTNIIDNDELDIDMELETEVTTQPKESEELDIDMELETQPKESEELDIDMELETEPKEPEELDIDMELETDNNIQTSNEEFVDELDINIGEAIETKDVIDELDINVFDNSLSSLPTEITDSLLTNEEEEVELDIDIDIIADETLEELEVATVPATSTSSKDDMTKAYKLKLDKRANILNNFRNAVPVISSLEYIHRELENFKALLQKYVLNKYQGKQDGSLPKEVQEFIAETDQPKVVANEELSPKIIGSLIRYIYTIVGLEDYSSDEFNVLDLEDYNLALSINSIENYLTSEQKQLYYKNNYSITCKDLFIPGSKVKFIKYFSELKNCLELSNLQKGLSESDSSTLQSKLLSKYFTFNFDIENIEYVQKVFVSPESESFICGHCYEKNINTNGFFQLGILPLQDSDTKDFYTLLKIPALNKCSYCGTTNILSEREIEELFKAIKRERKNEFSSFIDNANSLCSGFNLTRYTPSVFTLKETLPSVYEITGEDITATSTDVSVDFKSALTRYHELIDFFTNTIDRGVTLQNAKIETSSIEIKNIGKTISTLITEPLAVETKQRIENSDVLAKILCGILGAQYSSLKEYAINSLLTFISESSFYNTLSYRTPRVLEAQVMSRTILDYIDTFNAEELYELGQRIITILNIGGDVDIIEYTVPNTKSFDMSKLDMFKKVLTEQFDAKEKLLQMVQKEQNTHIKSLQDLTRVYSFIPISKINNINSLIKENLYYDDRIISFINETTNLMILNSLSEKFFEYWSSLHSHSLRLANIAKETKPPIKREESLLQMLKDAEKSWGRHKSIHSSHLASSTYLTKVAHNFLIAKDIKQTELLKLSRLREFLVDYDEFKLRKAFVDCEFLKQNSNYGHPLFKPFIEIVIKFLPECKEFIDMYGSDEYARYVYLLKNQFTREEVYDVLHILDTIKFSIIPERLKDESIKDYLNRYQEYQFKLLEGEENPDLGSEFFEIDHKFYEEISPYLTILNVTSLPYIYFLTNTNNLLRFCLMSDLLCKALTFSKERMLYEFSISPMLGNKLSKNKSIFVSREGVDFNKIAVGVWLNSFIYLDDDLNDKRLAIESETECITALLSDENIFKEGTKHLDEEVMALINEYYSDRR